MPLRHSFSFAWRYMKPRSLEVTSLPNLNKIRTTVFASTVECATIYLGINLQRVRPKTVLEHLGGHHERSPSGSFARLDSHDALEDLTSCIDVKILTLRKVEISILEKATLDRDVLFCCLCVCVCVCVCVIYIFSKLFIDSFISGARWQDSSD